MNNKRGNILPFQNIRFVDHEPVYESGMSAEQKYLQIVDSVKNNLSFQSNLKNKKVKGCQLHPQISQKCRKCKQILQKQELSNQLNNNNQPEVLKKDQPTALRLNTQNPWSNFSQKLLTCIQSTIGRKTQLQNIRTVKQLVNSTTKDQISIDCFLKGTTEVPTLFITLLYKLIKMRPTYEQITIMLRNSNINVKALAMLYLRVYCNYEDLFGWLCPKFEDDDLINPQMTISQFAKRLFDEGQLNYDGLRLPRLPIRLQKAINEHLGQISINADQLRKQQIRKRQESIKKQRQEEQQRQRILQEKRQKQKENQRQRSRQKEKGRQKSREKQSRRERERKRRKNRSRSTERKRSRRDHSKQNSDRKHKKNKKKSRRRKQSSSSDSSQSSSSSSSSSSSCFSQSSDKKPLHKSPQQKDIEKKIHQNPGIKKIGLQTSSQLQKPKNQSLSLQALKKGIKNINPISDEKKKEQILSRYGAETQFKNKEDDQEGQYSQSGSEQKYEIG